MKTLNGSFLACNIPFPNLFFKQPTLLSKFSKSAMGPLPPALLPNKGPDANIPQVYGTAKSHIEYKLRGYRTTYEFCIVL